MGENSKHSAANREKKANNGLRAILWKTERKKEHEELRQKHPSLHIA